MTTETPKNGLHTEYSARGWISGEHNYKDGKKHGKSTEFYDSGRTESEGNSRNSVLMIKPN